MILQLNGVNAFYGASQILFGVNVEVEEADSVCVLGRNGVGKSTMMKSIVGNLNPKEKSLITGGIRYCGDELVGLPAYRIARKGIAYVPQGRHIFPTLTTRENLMMAERRAQAGENAWNLERVYGLFPRLKERESFLGGRLSGGEQQMLTIARGLMQNPRLLLLDEITEGLAPIVVKELGEIIASLRRQNVTILLAEQNVNFALSASRKCYIMEKGHIAYSGLTAEIPKEVLNQYLGL